MNQTQHDIFHGLGIEIKFAKETDFLKIAETLTRIGIASKKDENTLFQSCHILHKQGRYAVLHFKEMFILDGKPSTISEEDLARRNKIARLLEDRELLELVYPEKSEIPMATLSQIKIVKFKDKPNRTLKAKYTIGQKKKST
jgi:hypothetical protein